MKRRNEISEVQQKWRKNQQMKMSKIPTVWSDVLFCPKTRRTNVVKVTNPFIDWWRTRCAERGGGICKELVWCTLCWRGCICASLPLAWCHSTLHHFHYSLLQQLTERHARKRLFPWKCWMWMWFSLKACFHFKSDYKGASVNSSTTKENLERKVTGGKRHSVQDN